jgi:NAD(P)H-quinone oxidoreductase subunit 5
VLVGVAAMAWGFSPARAPALWAVGFILSLALAPLIAGRPRRSGWWALAGPSAAFAVALAYFGLHRLLAHVLGGGGASTPPGPVLVSWVIGCFGLLFVVQGNVRARPKGILARRLYPWMFAGLYLDELFTRLTFRVWPARVQATTGELAAGRPALANVNYPGAL